VRQWGKETYKLIFTNKNYKYNKGLESGKQVVGPVSAEAYIYSSPPNEAICDLVDSAFR
jgi:hypothetical protein